MLLASELQKAVAIKNKKHDAQPFGCVRLDTRMLTFFTHDFEQ